MAQARVTDFFTSRKRNLDVQPSKRRKVVLEDVVESITTIKSKDRRTRTRTTTRSSSRVKAKTCEPAGPLKTNSKQCTQPLSSALDSPGETILSTKSSKSTSKAKETTEKCKTDILLPAVRTYVVTGDIKGTVPKDGFPATLECEAGSVSTAACDNHSVSPSSTPTKRRVNNKTVTVSTKRSRVAKTARRDLLSSLDSTVGTQEKGFNFKPFTQSHGEQADSDELGVEALSTSPRKKLQPHRRSTESSHDDSTKQSSPCKFIFRGSVSSKTDNKKTIATEQPLSSADDEPKVKGSDTSVKEEAKQKVTLTKLVKSTSVKATEKTAQPATKVLPSTEATAECMPQVSQVDNCSLSSETKEKKPTKEVNVLKLDAASFREKLAGCGQLSQLKERLAEFGKVAKATREIQKKKLLPRLTSPTKSEISNTESENKTPAYERFHSLAAPVPPSLTLPYHYKILDEMFRGVDTVVSMLHQRSELCTFTKLKTAVQQMVRRTFDVKNLGRIKTVYPTAYTFRQEKGLPCFGGKTSGYQLTLEAILEDKQAEALKTPVKSEKSRETKKEKFTAADLLERKAAFHRGLIDIVKKHHKEFLATLDRPLDVPDDKITRWHPKFRLDEVPAVEPSPLPLPPDTTTFTTAKDVLEQAKNKFTPSRVQRALEIVSAMSPNKKNVAEKTEKSATPNITPKKASNSSKNSLEGVPQSLLERIRAKEVKKLEHEMMRTPAQARHIDAISRLPELVRILRTFIVTQKKIAVPVDDVVQKLSDSYKTSLGIAESERHLKLMVELLPEWIQMVTVKKGSFIKIDKNRDVQQICAKLQKILKQNS